MPVPSKFNTYTHRLGFLCLATQRDGQTKKHTKKTTNSASYLRGEQTPRSPNFQGMQRWWHTTYFIQALCGSNRCVRSYGRKTHPKCRFCHDANEYMSPQRRHNHSCWNNLDTIYAQHRWTIQCDILTTEIKYRVGTFNQFNQTADGIHVLFCSRWQSLCNNVVFIHYPRYHKHHVPYVRSYSIFTVQFLSGAGRAQTLLIMVAICNLFQTPLGVWCCTKAINQGSSLSQQVKLISI